MPFIGKQSTSNSQITNYTTTVGSGGQTNFTVVIEGGDETHVYLNGVLLKETTDYTVSSTQVSLVSPAVENDIVEIKVFRSFALVDAVRASEGGTFSGDVTVPNLIIGDGGTIGSASDTDALTIDTSGDVGVGYSSPSSRLHVNGVLNGDILKLTGVGAESRGVTVSNFQVSGVNGVGVDFDAVGSGGVQGTLSFSTNSTERLRIHSSGNVELKTTNANLILPSGGGITFQDTDSSNDSITANEAYTLDSFETGTWAPTLTTNGTDFSSVSYDASRSGQYTKIGNTVYVSATMRTDAVTKGSASGSVAIGGLPFTVGINSTIAVSQCESWSGENPISAYAQNSTTNIRLQYRTSVTGNTASTQVADVGTGANQNEIQVSGFFTI